MTIESLVYPVILCGGDGTRLWPASRKALPKQFMPYGDTTLFQKTLVRAFALAENCQPLILCNENHRFMVANQIQKVMGELRRKNPSMKFRDPEIMLEPVGRNTAPAIALAALHHEENDPLLLVMPSDHELKDLEPLLEAVLGGQEAAEDDYLVTFGVEPLVPETGYGYIHKGKQIGKTRNFKVQKFVEKPDEKNAENFLASGEYFWNSGMFLLKASVFLNELEKFAPEILQACTRAYAKKDSDLDFIRIDHESFSHCPPNSIDYTVMEHTDRVAVAPLRGHWSDLGSWDSFHEASSLDPNGNAKVGDVYTQACANSYFMSQSRLVTGLGLKNIVVVETPDAVMVADKDSCQDIKSIVEGLKKLGRPEAELHARVYRPWGSYESLITGDRFQVKRIIVNPKGQLSLQRHFHRAEHWVVVRGTAKVHVDGEDMLLSEDQSTYIPLGKIHRLENPGLLPLEIIEIQTGSYVGEDDIERLEDKYGR